MNQSNLSSTEISAKAKPKIRSRFDKPSNRKSLAIIIALCLSGQGLSSQIVMAQQGLYEEGQIQLDNKEYQAARDTFAKLVETDNAKQDAALYWLAYSQFKNGHDQEALNTISQLTRNHSQSRWLDDAAALRIEIQDESGQSVDVDNEEMKLYALNSLMNSPSEKSFEILKRLLAGHSSKQVKNRALFVLSQINHPQAFALITTLASDSSSPQLQEEAIRVLGISGSEQSMTQLIDIYRSSDNEATKMKVLHSYMIAGQSEQLIELAKSESNPALKRQSIHLIGVMSNADVLLEMYRSNEFKDFRSDILHSLAIGDGIEALLEISGSEQDQQLLAEAVQKMGINGNDASAKQLTKIYQENDNPEVRKAVIQALFIQTDGARLSHIVKTENDPELKREALQKLSLLGSDESLQFFEDILNNED